MTTTKSPIEYLSYSEYSELIKKLEGGHWTQDTVSERWDYFARVVNLIKALDLTDPSRIIEMGTMGISCVKNGHTIDYDKWWDFPGKAPTYLHDAREFPWPINDKSYDLFIALRVFQHLAPVQKESINEAFRIAKKVIIVVPDTYDNHVHPDSRGITYKNFVEFLNGVHPNIFTITSIGSFYYWDSEKPSYLNLEGVMLSQKVGGTSSHLNTSFLSKVKRKLKSLLK